MENENSIADALVAGTGSSSVEYQTVNLLGTWLLLMGHRKLILSCAAAGLVLGVVAAYAIHPKFDATARFLPPSPKEISALSLFPSRNQGDHYMGLINSRTVADDVIEHQHLREYFHAKNATQARMRLAAISKIASDKDQFVTVTVRAAEPQTAVNIANEFVEALYRLDHSLATVESQHRREFFEGPLEQVKNRLAEAEEDLKRGQQKTGIVLPEAQIRLGVGAIAELKQEITTREAQLAGLRSGGTEQNPQVIALRSQIASLQAQVARLQQQNGGAGSSAAIAQMPELTMEVERKARELKFQTTLFEILSRQYENARLEQAYTPAIELVDHAVLPDEKAWPPRKLFFLVGGLVGGLLGVMYVFLEAAEFPRRWKQAKSEALARAAVSEG